MRSSARLFPLVVLNLLFVIWRVRPPLCAFHWQGALYPTGKAWPTCPRTGFWPARHESQQHPENHGSALIRKRFAAIMEDHTAKTPVIAHKCATVERLECLKTRRRGPVIPQMTVAEVILGFVPYKVSSMVMENGSCTYTGFLMKARVGRVGAVVRSPT